MPKEKKRDINFVCNLPGLQELRNSFLSRQDERSGWGRTWSNGSNRSFSTFFDGSEVVCISMHRRKTVKEEPVAVDHYYKSDPRSYTLLQAVVDILKANQIPFILR